MSSTRLPPRPLRALLLACALPWVSACFDFDEAYCASYCDGGAEDAGDPDAGPLDAGGTDAGSPDAGESDAGEPDAGAHDAGESDGGAPDAGAPDGGCGPAVQLTVIAPASFRIDECSPAVRVQLRDACGGPAAATASVSLTLTSSAPTMALYSDATCSFSPLSWSIPAGASELSLNVTDSAPGMPTLTASASGLGSGVQALSVECPSGQKACPGRCVPSTGCCSDAECTVGGLPWVCNSTTQRCAPPPCTGFPANCTVYDDRTAAGASRTVTHNGTGFAPKCMRVTTTQDVTFSGNFILHPLQQTCGPSDRQMTTTFGSMKTVRFPDFGTYGYRCANHPDFEQGSVRVP